MSIALFNFKHPVRTTLSDVGATDRLSDIRETLRYVRTSPCVSIAEQDFALFFKEPTYQAQTRSGSLVRYPERALAIAYAPFLFRHSRPASQMTDSDNRPPRSSHESAERRTIEDLTRRIAELEQADQTLAVQSLDTSASTSPADPPKPATDRSPALNGETQQRLLDLIKQLETRISELERQRLAPQSH